MSDKITIRSSILGRAVYRLWHRPKNRLRDVIAAGGPWEMQRTEAGRREMEAAAHQLPPLGNQKGGPPLELHLLTGKRFWYQTAFCLWSFSRQADRDLVPVIYDDGTLSTAECEPLKRLFPRTRFVTKREIVDRLDSLLPAAKFPFLRERWQHYPNIRKLTDVHVGMTGWKLVVDSDLLFFRNPAFIKDWLDHPTRPLHAVDCETSYGYPRGLMNELAGAPVAELVNVGLTGLESAALDWGRMEHWCRVLIERHQTNYYLEQALIAMLVAGKTCAIAPALDYVTRPSSAEARRCQAVMHHYVANSKKWYFQYCWKTAMEH